MLNKVVSEKSTPQKQIRDSEPSVQSSAKMDEVLALYEKLQATENRYIELASDLPIYIYELDCQHRTKYANKAALGLYGLHLEDLLGKNCYQYFPADLAQKYWEDHEYVLKTGKTLDMVEENINSGTGKKEYVRVIKSAVIDGNNKITGVQCMYWSITDKVMAEKKLQSTENWLKIIAQNAPMEISVINRNGDILYFQTHNHNHQKPENIYALWHPNSHSAARKNIEKMFDTNEKVSFVTQGVTNGVTHSVNQGEETFWHHLIAPITLDNDNQSAVCFSSDITKQRKLENEARQSEHLNTLGLLVGGVAHDFNNLITVILGYAEMLTAQLAGKKQALKDLERIIRSAYRCTAMNKQLLGATGRNMSGRHYPFDLCEVANDMEKTLKRIIYEGIELDVVVKDCPLMVNADPGQIEQILMNLVVNARDAIEDKGQIRIELSLDEVVSHKEISNGRYCKMTVSDTASGIPEEILPHIFKPFFTSKKPGKGTGLGLVNVKNIVDSLNGFIRMETALGKGSQMIIHLPLTEESEDSFNRPEPVTSGTKQAAINILIIEQERDICNLMSRILCTHGYRTIVVTNTEDASQVLLINQKIDLVLMEMSFIDAADFDIEALKKKTRVAFISSLVSSESRQKLGDENLLLYKPFDTNALIQFVETRLKQAL